MKKLIYILFCLLPLMASAQVLNPLIPSKKNDRLLREQAEREKARKERDAAAAAKRAQEKAAAANGRAGSAAATAAATDTPAATATADTTTLEFIPSDSIIVNPMLIAPITTTTTEYDPVTGQYLLRTKIGDVEIATPTLLTAEEYKNYNEQKVMNRYWQQKISEVGHSNERKFDITDMKFNIGPADRVFGPGGVQLKMQGSAELLFGFKHQHIENPSLTQKARNNNIFDFDEKIQASVQAKVGSRLNFNMSYNTESSFSFDQQNLKLAYKGEEDDIIQSIEAGNVTMDLNSSLIQGSKALFGVKANLKFGKLKVQALVSQQNSEATTVNSQGGAQMTPFEVTADNYDENRHFFLSYFFRDRYEEAMKTLPYVASGITINKIEVWITNKKANFDNARNLIAFVDLGESGPYNYAEGRNEHIFNKTWASEQLGLVAPQNTTNKLYTDLSSQAGIRDISNVSSILDELGYGIESGEDFEKIESARLLNSSEYILNSALGYLSLKTALHEDEVLAVAYEYTYQGNVYQVGEFSTDAGAELKAPNALFVKLLKSNGNSPNKKEAGTWDLMMKNIYSIGAASVSQDKFELNIYYRNDSIGTDLMYIDEGNIKGRPLLRVMGLDRLDSKNNTFSDGKFDFIPGYTVLTSTGRIIFPALEPFGNYLRKQIGDATIADKYSFQELYDSTRVSAEEFTERNKFILKGKYLGSGGNEISLGAMNVPRGSVKVTAGGATLIENVDYTVDYMMGKVTILNESIIESGTNVSVSLENQSTFSMQRKTLLGAHLEYQFNPDLVVGGTIMYMSEKPLTTKVNSGSEPIANTIWGLNFAWRTELPWLNTAINAIPWMKAEAPSTFSINGEFAHLIPGHTRDVGSAGTAYIDDFEATQTGIDVHYPSYWHLSATPRNANANDRPFAKEDATKINEIQYNSNRAHLSWYTVDPIFGYPQSNTPNHIRDRVDILSDHRTRIVYEQEIYPNKEVLANEDTRLAVLNLSFYPEERGQYNIDAEQFGTDGKLTNPYNKWGGMMRKLDNTDFERSNIEYIEFWMMDPKLTNDENVDVDLYFNLGDLSEDILRDGKKSFENGLPTSATDSSRTTTSIWGRVPKTNSTVMAFSNEAGSRQYQDLGLNGLNDEQEYNFRHMVGGAIKTPYKDFVDALKNKVTADTLAKWETDPFSPINDPAGDNYHYYRGSDYDQQEVGVLERYKRYNGTQGNSPATEQQTESYGTAASLQPDVEDINLDNTLSEYEKYYEYKVHISKDLKVGEQYVVSETKSNVTLRNGQTEQVTWYQFKIPLKGDGMEKVGTIRNFKSIRFMRMYMTHSEKPVHLRFGSLDLVRGEWRSYNKPLYEPQYEGLVNPGASLDVQAVNIEENGTRHPVNYILPPGISRQTDPGQAQLIAQNEQAMVLRVHNLAPHDGRAVYKGTAFDMRNYKRLQMFIHAEKDSVGGDPDLSDGDLSCFIRLGTDLKNNYYEYEIPLELTPAGIYNNNNENDRYRVWPKANYMDFALSNLVAAKTARNRAHRSGSASVNIHTPYVVYDVDDGRPDSKITVLGNPTLEDVEYILIGVRNSGTNNHSGEVWVNELRLSEFDESGGVAAMANVSLAISDIAQFNASGRIETAGYGSIESNVLTRNKEDNYQISLSAALEAGRLLPEKAKLQIPLYVSYSNNTTKPKYDPLDSDVKLSESLDTYNTSAERDSVKALSNRVQKSTSFSVTNMKVNIKSKKQDMFYDPANFSISASYNKQEQRTPEVQKDITTEQRGSFQYAFNFNPKPWEPFKNVKKVDKIKALKEFNIYYLPQSWSFTTSMQRQFSETIQRDLTNSGYSVKDLTTYSKDFTWDRHFDFKYNLTKNMKFSFQTAMNSTVDEGTYTPEIIRDWAFTNDYYEAWKDTIRRSLAKWGAPYAYQQVFTASWSVPFNRIPYVEALTANATYNANYNWTRTQSSSNSGNNNLGNTITSTRSIQLDGGINFETLYQKSKYWKQMTQHYTGRQRARAFKPKTYTQTLSLKKGVPQEITHRLGSTQLAVTATDSTGKRVPVTFRALDNNKVSIVSRADGEAVALTITTRDPNKRSAAQITGDMFAYLGTMIRRVQITYRNTNSMAIPGFAPEVGFMGQGKTNAGFAPGYDFAFGFFKDNYVSRAQEKGWLSGDTSVVQPATISKTSDLDIKIQLEPLPGLKIALSGKRYNASSTSIIYSYGDLRENLSGSFNTTQIAIGTAFARIGSPSENFASSVFDQFMANRDIMRDRVQKRYEGVPYPNMSWMKDQQQIYSPDGKYHVGEEDATPINPNSADVLVPAFLAAYSGKNINKMGYNPFLGILKILPNWSVTYDGLGKIAGIRDHFKSFTLTHAYTCKYSIGSYSSFSTWVPANGSDKTLGFIRDVATGKPVPSSAYDIGSVTLSETFSPLIGVNMTLKNSLSFKSEYRRQRNLALSVTALQITEGHTEEFVIGAGYTIKNLNAIIKKSNGGQTKVSNDLKLSVDISYKNVKSFLRKIDEGIAQASSGTKVFTLKFAADYVISQKVNLQLYYDHEGTTPLISTSYPVSTDNVGINLKFMLTR